MKKYILIVLFILLILLVYFPFGTKKYEIDNYIIKIPRMSIKEKSTKKELVFNSFRDYRMLKKDIKNILKEYQIIKNGKKEYYYDIKQNLLIKKYELKKGFLYNKIIIKYE